MVNVKKKAEKIKPEKLIMLLTFFAVFAGLAFAQTSTSTVTSTKKTITTTTSPAVSPTATPAPVRRVLRIPNSVPASPRSAESEMTEGENEIPAEKFIKVNGKTDVQLCVQSGNVKINGWDRNEVRAMVEGGTDVGFKILYKNPQGEPAVVKVVGYDAMKNPVTRVRECLAGDNIELDVPRGATVKVSGREYEAEVSSVFRAEVTNNIGSIVLNNISQKIYAKTYEGDLRIENSGGEITLVNTNGNIFAFNAKPVEFSNVFSARTNSGVIKLQSVDYPQIVTKSISGTIDFSGKILSGGQYNFDTQNGVILLSIPQQSSCQITAVYGFGNFQTDLTMTNVIKSPGQPRKLTGQIGSGDATMDLNTVSGAISIKRKE